MEQAAVNLDELYAAHSAYLNKYMYKLTRDREDAADLVQDIFLKLCLQGSLPDHPKAWLSQTGYRLFIDQWRRKQRLSQLQLEKAYCNIAAPEQAALDREFERYVDRLLLRLNPRMRTALYLRIYRHSSYEEIARMLDCSQNTVKTFIRRGKAQLSKWL
ncbi:RNA polymerase sigma factor [Paenibacillus nasutitermitis]|uniref:RNA polymerase sigma factor n=1 Tax=Paenibacillus nasutitermitis TaxID=1652958 RepID=A0A916YSS0_9BACL|nr:RNA polymerase sigma factor [Paenibacillus nasutitermitis]GGD58721.1 RNA polymerase sigma factor [Paenibacillus nasutitermitis]